MSYKLLLLSALVLCSSLSTLGQLSGESAISASTYWSSDSSLPFWFTHNRDGKIIGHSASAQVVNIQANYKYKNILGSPFSIRAGTDVLACYSKKGYLQFNELYAAISAFKFKLEAGYFTDDEVLNGLSSTNMQIDRSLNARPLPKLRFATDGFIPFFFWKDWFWYKAEYDEGLLGSNQYVTGAHLHHKSLFAKVKFKKETYFSIGLNHWVMWGGLSPEYGQLPYDFESYFLYITGREGSSKFPATDRQNVAGNQLGSYYMELLLRKPNQDITLYYSHPFEDKSGMEYDNWRDNLLGISILFKNKKFTEQVVYEYMHTKHQSGDTHLYGYMRGRDNYFNHGYYKSGFTYEGFTMSSPVFSPLRYNEKGIVTGISNTRLSMHHLAARGQVSRSIKWDGRITLTHNQGTYDVPYSPSIWMLYSQLAFSYSTPSFPVELSVSVGADAGKINEYQKNKNRIGVAVSISKKW